MFYMYIAICFLLLFRSILTVDKTRPSKLLVLYVGGFRPDYLDIDGLKGFRSLINNGVNVEYLDPVFPTLTFPNYYSIVTGMYPEKHGLISDYMFDPLNYETFEAGKNPESTKSYWWNSVEPIWISTSKLRISTYMELAYGCQVAIKNEHPVYCRPPNNYGSLTMSDVCDGVSEGVKRIADGSVDFVFTYIDHVNTAGRKYGPFDKRTRAAVRHVDHLIQRIITETEKLGLSEMLNIVLVSDHGMEYCSPVFVIDMSRYIVSADVVRFKEDGAMLWIWPADNKIMQVYKHVTSFVKTFNSERFEGVYLRKDIPEKYRLGLSYRASPILVVARPGTYLLPNITVSLVKSLNLGR
ncbi:glycerophosphocholine cholinephosphodiesterase ENPP6-like isoform X2 [Tubulanus polymorphus]|uniref:glycerophosphocholine cholinephosphodiesterase ENPP6-like isoform X2 n=1 Tax=Tubulanus polymorphus TaxID=672921 RepID=UPI003DA36A63